MPAAVKPCSRVRAITGVATLVGVVLWLLSGAGFASAQESNVTHRFFGFSGDVTIDGEPLPAGALILGVVDGTEIGRTIVNQAGAWILTVDGSYVVEGDCNVTLVFDDLAASLSGESCPLRVRIDLLSGRPPPPESTAQAEQSAVDDNSAPDNQSAASAEVSAEGGETESSGTTQSRIVRPRAPKTGSGGVNQATDAGSNDWQAATAIAVVLAAGGTVALWFVLRRFGA